MCTLENVALKLPYKVSKKFQRTLEGTEMLSWMVVPLIQLVWWVMVRSLQTSTYSFFRGIFGNFQYFSDLCELVGLP